MLALAAATLAACASVPSARPGALATDQALTTVIAERHNQIEHFVDRRALQEVPQIALPQASLADGAHGTEVSAAQAALVANHAARSLCLALARHASLIDEPADGVFAARLVITAIKPTSGSAAGASSVIDYFVPGPARLPVGLGGLAAEAELRDSDGSQRALMRWARGANPLTHDAKVSAIGDAWQLAARFGKDFARLLLDTDPARSGLQRKRLPEARVKANRALCAQRFGSVNLAGRGVSIFLPLAPEAIDPGPPSTAQESVVGE